MKLQYIYFSIILCTNLSAGIIENLVDLNISKINKRFSNFLNKLNNLSDEEIEKFYKYGTIPSPIEAEKHKRILNKNLKTLSLPEKFDLRDLNLLSEVKDQGNCGSCWTFAGYASIEGYIKSHENLNFDFSEDNLKHNHGFDPILGKGSCSGGNVWMISAYLSRGSGAILEIDDPYNPSKNSETNPNAKMAKYIDDIIFLPVRESHLDIEYIKEIIYNKKTPLYTTFLVPSGTAGESGDSIFNEETNSYYYKDLDNSSVEINHAVVIVGWDDNYDTKIDGIPNKGAFIIKNSWGKDFGEDGFAYVSYYDDALGFESLAYFIDKNESELEFNKIYYHDEFGQTLSFGFPFEGEVYGANIFEAQNDGNLTAINFFATQSNTKYEINLYKELIKKGDYIELSNKIGDSQSGNIEFRGSYTIKLNNQIEIKKGEKFIITLKVKNSLYQLPIETPIERYASNASSNAQESLFSLNGNIWIDFKDTNYFKNANLNIKALVKEDSNDKNSNSFNLNLIDGWNLIANPINEDINSSIFESEVIWKYINQNWINPKTLNPTDGYWIYKNSSEKSIYNFEGDSYKPNFENINNGWNLIGTGEKLFSSEIQNFQKVWIYRDKNWLELNESNIINRGEGFWILK